MHNIIIILSLNTSIKIPKKLLLIVLIVYGIGFYIMERAIYLSNVKKIYRILNFKVSNFDL